jgi:small subunit ribosomal protein S21
MKISVKNGNVEKAIRILKRKVTESDKLFVYKEKQFFEKKSSRKQKRKASAIARERKRQEKDMS